MIQNILYTSFISGRTQVISCESDLAASKVYELIAEREGIPSNSFSLCFDGKTIINNDEQLLQKHEKSPQDGFISLQIYIPVVGGKGGFGSMLRALGAQIEKTTNKEACRDLSGRRLRDVNAEKKFKEWINKAAQRKEEETKKKKAKLLKMKREPKIEFQDEDYFKTKSEIPEKVDEAVEEGIRKAFMAKKKPLSGKQSTATCTVTSSTVTVSSPSSSKSSVATSSSQSLPTKRKEMASSSATSQAKKRKAMLWMGLDLDEDDLSDKEEEAVADCK